MLSTIKDALKDKEVVLASQSLRRKELLHRNCGIENFVCCPSGFAEDIDKQSCPDAETYVQRTATCKLHDVLARRCELNLNPYIVISADTIVVIDDHILEKPSSMDEAMSMIRRLSGRAHRGISSKLEHPE
jgi:septum formation protein